MNKFIKSVTMVSVAGSIVLGLCSCTQNIRAKSFGGTATEQLKDNVKLINVTWKESDLWVLTRPMNETDKAETYEFQEISSFGLVSGKVILKENKTK